MSPERPGIPDTVGRFSDRVEHYTRYRPRYPAALVEWTARECGWTEATHLADVGSGTGILSEVFLNAGFRVTGIEPNAEMRAAGSHRLAHHARFRSHDGTAEHTGLADGAVDGIIAGQAAHWFDLERARAEFRRILAPRGWVMLVWNERARRADAFLEDYDALLRLYGTDYETVEKLGPSDTELQRFLGTGSYRSHRFSNQQSLDLEGLEGRILSSSYAPGPGHPKHASMMKAIERLHRKHRHGQTVTIRYDCSVYLGRLDD